MIFNLYSMILLDTAYRDIRKSRAFAAIW